MVENTLVIYLDKSSFEGQKDRLAEIMVIENYSVERAQEEAQIMYNSVKDIVEEGIKKYNKSYSEDATEGLINMGIAIFIETANQMKTTPMQLYNEQFSKF